MSSTNTKPRSGSSALVPGVTLFSKSVGRQGESYLTIRASAQVEGKQKLRTWGVEKHGLDSALWQACQWRYEHADPPGYESARALYEDAKAARRNVTSLLSP